MKKILIYRGPGADPVGIGHIVQALRTLNLTKLELIDSTAFLKSEWMAKTSLLIFPGGRDIPYHAALKGQPNEDIRNYVEQGGNYLGICAGGYYGSAAIEFEKGGPLEVVGKRELAFFPGTAYGPAYGTGKFSYQSDIGSCIANLTLTPNKENAQAYFNGGCAFHSPEKYKGVTVIARYADIEKQPAAIVECRVGKGRAILSGVHPERDSKNPLFHTLLSRCLCLLGFLFLAGCVNKTPSLDDALVQETLRDRIDAAVVWQHQEEERCRFIEEALDSPLTANSAIQIALLNNPHVQATFEEIGIAQADLIEAGLFTNPSIELEVRYPKNSRLYTNIEYLISTSILDLFLIPLRTKLAETEFEQAKLRVSNTLLDLAFDVREAFYELVEEQEKRDALKNLLELAEIRAEMAKAQLAAGNIYSLEWNLYEAEALKAKIALDDANAQIAHRNETLLRLMGFQESVCLDLPSHLEVMEFPSLNLAKLEEIALEYRLDLQVARLEIERICQKFGLKKPWTYTNLQAGLAGERELEGENVLGPGVAIDIPLFNYGQGARMRLLAELRQAYARLQEKEIAVLTEVREAYHRFHPLQNIVLDAQNHLIPLQKKSVDFALSLYNVMGMGMDDLIRQKSMEIEILYNFAEQKKEALLNEVALDRALGGNLGRLQ